MARILHTSDWHLGAVFHGVDRSGDEQAALDAIVRICAERAVDSVVIAGDVFDIANPGAAETRRYYDTLLRLVREGGVGSVVVIAGNHDSGARLDGPRELLDACQVQVRGVLSIDAPPGDCLLTLVGRDGTPVARCAAVPYLRETDLHMSTGDAAIAARQAAAMQERCAGILAQARAEAVTAGLPLVIVAHAFVRGGLTGGRERPVYAEGTTVGSLGQIDAACIATGSSYAAFGHLHRAQRIGGQEHWRYSGSLLPAGFDAVGTRCAVVLATVAGPGPALVETVDLPVSRRYAAVIGTFAEVRSAIAELPEAAPGEPDPLLMATVRLEQERHGLYAEVTAWAAARGWRAIRVLRETLQPDGVRPALAPAAGVDIDEVAPIEVFRHAHRGRHGGHDPASALESAFLTLLADEQAGREA
jgi:DNA repair protein SbcD/Mre11